MKETETTNEALLAEAETLRKKLKQLERENAALTAARDDKNSTLLDVIRQVQAEFIADADTPALFDRLLHHLISITDHDGRTRPCQLALDRFSARRITRVTSLPQRISRVTLVVRRHHDPHGRSGEPSPRL